MTVEVTGAVDLELEVGVVAAVCRAATRSVGGHRSDVDVVVDPLDTTVWVHLPASAVHPAVAGLRARGLDAAAVNDHRVHVTGWEVRLLRWRLGLLAAVDTLTAYPDLTGDLVGYHQHRHAAAGGPVEAWVVLADVEAALRVATPLPPPPAPSRRCRRSARVDRRRGGRPRTAHRGPPRLRRTAPHRLHRAATGQPGGLTGGG